MWKPDLWNKLCIIGDSLAKKYRVYLNDKLIFHSNRYNGGHKKEAGNIFLLNGFSFSQNKFLYPFKGEITDLNIWNKTLSVEDMDKWRNCNFGTGNLVNWNEARFKLNNIQVTEVDMDQICQIKDPQMIIPFSKKMNFNPSDCALISDADTDLRMAKEAGITIVVGFNGGWQTPPALTENRFLIEKLNELKIHSSY